MDIVKLWIEALLKKHQVDDLHDLPVYVVKGEIWEMKGTLENEKVFLVGGSPHSKENIKNMKVYIKILKGVLEL
jgi:hypothetical protein